MELPDRLMSYLIDFAYSEFAALECGQVQMPFPGQEVADHENVPAPEPLARLVQFWRQFVIDVAVYPERLNKMWV